MRRLPVSVVLVLAAAAPAAAQVNYDTVQIRTVKVAEGVYMLMGAGGNIGVSVGSDGVILIDDQFAPLSDKIKAAVAALGGPIRFLLNTHWHFDHTGGNENFAKSGVVIVAHENVRRRMSVEQFISALNRREPPSPAAALPVVTFTDAITFYLNGDSINVFHVAPAHTDGDAVIWFRKANVMHMGDTFFNGRYPLIDLSSGGSVDGMVAAADRVLALVDANTRIIPGHGPLGDRPALQTYRAMLVTVRDRIRQAVAADQTLEQVQAAKPTAEFDAIWGKGSITPARFVEIVYTDLAARR
ncbi:MAG: MBL fold metallo-hydrolase [Gemmatimonadetes bacterium]|nr:MAG: MBL fold metallo-hydrolase [Gemmatimonadota bacterium]PYP62599.1 MAG: MBL fold metallo-hydrolase [Gemmatimonadota bacterium]